MELGEPELTPTHGQWDSQLTPTHSQRDSQLTPTHGQCDSPCRQHPCRPLEQRVDAENANSIKGTGYSKSWVISILLELLKEVERHAGRGGEGEEDGEADVEVTEEQQNDLGTVWDMSLNEDVARFLMESECNAVEIFITALYNSRAPRINEICIGILANLCSVHDLCVKLTQTTDLVKLICPVLSNIEFDSPTLREAIRLAVTCLKNTEVKVTWLEAVLNTPDLTQLLLFVLESATDVALLGYTGELLTTLMETVDDLCEDWASPQLVSNLLVAIRQIGHKEKEDIKPLLTVLHLLSTSQTGVQSLMSHSEGVMKALVDWLREVCDDDILVITDHLSVHGCVISLLNILFVYNQSVAHLLCSDNHVLRDMMKTLDAVYNIYPAHDNPATLPHCILPSTRPRPTHQASQAPSQSAAAAGDSQTAALAPEPATDGAATATAVDGRGEASDVLRGEGCDVQRGENRDDSKSGHKEGRDGQVGDADRGLYIALFESLQEFFRNTFNHMHSKLEEEQSHEDSKEGAKRHHHHHHHARPVPQFQPVVRHLDTCPRRRLCYLVSVLVYNVPDAGRQEDTSPEGWQAVQRLQRLCSVLRLRKAVKTLDDVVSTVRLTAGVSDS